MLALLVLGGISPAAHGVEQDISSACGGNLAVASAAALEHVQDASGYYFACAGDQITIEPTLAGEPIAKVAFNSITERSADLTGLSERDREAVIDSIAPDDDTNGEAQKSPEVSPFAHGSWSRTINHEYRETLSWITTYGYSGGDPSIEPFVSEFTNRVILYLGQSSVQTIEYSWTSLDGRWLAPHTSTDVYENQGLLPPTMSDMYVQLGSGTGADYHYRQSYTESGAISPTTSGKSYHLKTGIMNFYDLEANHFFEIYDYAGAGHRWLCMSGGGVCLFPNGEEAPVI